MAFGILRKLLKRRAATPALQPGGEDALLQKAIAHHRAGRLGEAELAYLEILRDAPQHPAALHHLGMIAMQSENFDLAHELIVESLAKNPTNIRARENLGQVLRTLGRIDEAIELYRATLAMAPEAERIHSALCFASCFSARYDAQAIFAEHCAWAQRFAPATAADAHANAPEPERRLRLGYVAFNFSNFIIGCYLEEVFRHHDRAAFEVFLYHNGKWQGPWSERMRRQAEHWREIGEMDDAAAAAAIRADGIDVLVDLSGHLGDNRLLTFARKPAPVQVSWLSYPVSTGLAAMDYRLTDPYCDPPGLTEHLYTEKLHRLPHTWWCFHPAIVSPITPLPALRNGWITFGSFNAYAKISEPTIELWARLLAALPQARLFIMTVPRGSATAALRERFQRLGIGPERLEIEARVIPDRFYEMFARADIALDPFPCNGGATTLDALWNGVPVITLAGTTCLSRAGVSMLSNAGLDDLIARDKDEYLAIARRLAADPNALQSLRSGLRARLQASPIMNAAAFTADLEAAYRHMWRSWCEATKPAEFEAAIRLHESGDLDAAEMHYRAILQADPRNPDVTHLLGLIAHQRGDHAAAVAQIGAAISLQADKAAYHANLGNALAALARFAPAIASYREALRLAPDHALARHNLGIALAQSGEFTQAADEFRRAAAARPSAETRYALAGALIAIADRDPRRADCYEEAAAELRAIWQETADPAEARSALAYCLQQLKRWTDAAEHNEAVLAVEPDHPRAVLLAAQLALRRGALSEAESWFRKALQRSPDDPALLEALAGALLDQGQTEAAEPILRRALRLAPARPEIQRNVVRHIAQEIERQADPKDRAGAPAGDAAPVPPLSPNAANAPIGTASPVPPIAIQAGTPKLSVVICSIDRKKFDTVTAAYARLLAGVPHEIIGIHDARSLCEGYNRGIGRSKGESILFSHDDIEILTPDFAVRLLAHLGKHDIIGACGTARVTDGLWIEACWPHVQGLVAHGYPQGAPDAGRYRVMVFDSSAEDSTSLLQALDGMFLGVNREVLDRRRFDAETFDGFHLYDMDFTFGAYLDGFDVAVFRDITMVHHTAGASPGYGEAFARYRLRFHDKYRAELSGAQAPNPSGIRFLPALFDTTDQVRRFCERLLRFRRGEIARSAES